MQKTSRILAIIAASLVCVSMLLLLVSIPFQKLIFTEFLSARSEIVGFLPIFPVLPFSNCLLYLGCILLLCICCGNKKGGIWLELIVFILMSTALPLINSVATNVVNWYCSQVWSSYYLVAYNSANYIANFCMIFYCLGVPIAYLAGGMSIAFKVMNKKLARSEARANELVVQVETLSNRESEQETEETAMSVLEEDFVTEEEVIFCRKCGEKLLNDSAFCVKCGEKVKTV